MSAYKNLLDDGIELIHQGKFKEAIESISKSIELKNDWEISYFYRAVAYQANENMEEAILDYTKAIKLNPKMCDAYYNRAKIMLEIKNCEINLDKIIDDLNMALSLDENFIDALFAMAAALKKKGDYHKALEYLDRLLQLQPDAVHARALKKLLLQKYIV
ncbi:MAG: tetratricopeptide repeat protein [Candidatus Gastranaerophilales bacterium]|nr:tetratricopeptide repeat protein [Candidatus Gastranaerophilales bacterium]